MEWKGRKTTTTTRSNTSRLEVPYLPLTVMASPEAQKDRPAAARPAECKAERLRQRAWNRNHRTTSPCDVADSRSGTANKSHEKSRPFTLRPLKDISKAFASPFVSWRVLGAVLCCGA